MDKIFAFNLKSNLIDEEKYFNSFFNKKHKKVIFFPSFLQLNAFFNKKTDNFSLGVQNICSYENMNITGEITFDMLKNNIEYAIIGHSERRYILNESDEQIKQKIELCLVNNITPVLCIGEKVFESQEKTFDFLEKQVNSALNNNYDKVIIAYEPVYAIGTGNTCDINTIEKVCEFLKNRFNPKAVLYGGSVNEHNIEQLKLVKTCDGYLIGKTSLEIEKVNKIIE